MMIKSDLKILSICASTDFQRIETTGTDFNLLAQQRNRPHVPLRLDEGVLQFDSLAKYAIFHSTGQGDMKINMLMKRRKCKDLQGD